MKAIAGMVVFLLAMTAQAFEYYDESTWPEDFDMGHRAASEPYKAKHKIQIHAASWHWRREKERNEVNPGLGYLYEGEKTVFTIGGYENSLYRETYYVGAGIREGGFRMMIGFATGYSDNSKPAPVPMLQYNKGPIVVSLMLDAFGFGLEF